MPHDPLTDLLRHADADAPAADVPAGLADRVRARARRRTTVRRAAAAGAVALVAIVAALVAAELTDRGPVTPSGGSRTAGGPSTDELDRTVALVARLEAEADSRLRVVDALERQGRLRARLRELNARLNRPDPLTVIASQIERSTEMLVKTGDAMVRTEGLTEPARQSYRLAAELLPDSGWAVVARRRLAELNGG